MRRLLLMGLLVTTAPAVTPGRCDELGKAASPETQAKPTPATEPATNQFGDTDDRPTPLTPLPMPLEKLLKSGVALNPEGTVVLDRTGKRVLLRTQVACRECLLEMLCCTEQTKEHEAIVSLRGRAQTVHAGLLALGTQPGTPATFLPEFKPPTGPKVKIFANWVDATGKVQRVDARTWMRTSVSHYFSQPLPEPPAGIKLPLMELRYDPYNKEILWYGAMSDQQRDKLLTLCSEKTYQAAIRYFHKECQSKPMTADFVFAGSYQEARQDTGEKYYAAEEGYVICVANFAAAMIDITEASSADDGGQAYEGWTKRIPERGQPVILELIPEPAETK